MTPTQPLNAVLSNVAEWPPYILHVSVKIPCRKSLIPEMSMSPCRHVMDSEPDSLTQYIKGGRISIRMSLKCGELPVFADIWV